MAPERDQHDRVGPAGAVHQGIAALVEPLPYHALEDLLAELLHVGDVVERPRRLADHHPGHRLEQLEAPTDASPSGNFDGQFRH